MTDLDTLRAQVKRLLVDNLMLQLQPEEIVDALPLFGPGGLGLDSVDALQIVVALDKNYGFKIPDPETARTVLASVDSLTLALQAHLQEKGSK